ncbi:E3 ubiquitin-protein ligase Topors-like [Sarcophilus harrisii]|uniref:RING-type E3 ubiquitin transferase n=1 Tax=Sarcophilus harrisii TaxID=9305 RepID=A0A7N4NUW3_SARHA|nr:E3 ubiquitin-protein ligase Topors-like [Sarcophilus harrisii]
MPIGRLPHCQCPIYLNGSQNGADLNPSTPRFVSDCPHERFAKKTRHPHYGEACHPFSQSSRLVSDMKKQELYHVGNDNTGLPEENNSYVDSFPSCQPGSEDGVLSDDTSSQTNPLRYQAVQELLKQFSGNKQDHLHEVSSGFFKEQIVIKFRRALYFTGLRVLYVRGGGFYRHISADYFLRNPNCLQRLIPWLKRELIAIYGDYGYTGKNILTIILQNMTDYDLDSQSFSEILEPYLLKYTKHFLHEFISFARSPFSMKTYDQRAIYECPSSNGRGNLFTISPINDKWALPALENYTEMAKTIHDPWNKEVLPRSSSKHNMTYESSSVSQKGNPEESSKTKSKNHLTRQTMSESGDSKGVISSQSCSHIAHLKSMGDYIELLEPASDSSRYTSEAKPEGRKLQLEEDKCLGDNRANYSASDISTTSNSSSPREKKLLTLCQPVKTREEELEKNKNPDSFGKFFPRSPPMMMKEIQQTLFGNSSQTKDQTWRCYSENVYSHRRHIQKGQRERAFRKERLKCQPSCQDGELNSHPYRRLKSLHIRDYNNCLKQELPQSTEDKPHLSHRPRKRRSRSRDHSDRSLRGSYLSEPLLTITCEAQEGNKGDDNYQPCRRVVLANTTDFIRTRGRAQRLCNREKAFRVKSPNICLHPENHRPNCQCMKKSGTVCIGSIPPHHEKMGKKRRFKSQHSEKENNETMPNSFPTPVQMRQIQQSPSYQRQDLSKQFVSLTAQASRDIMNHIRKRQEKYDQKVEGRDYFGSKIFGSKQFLEKEHMNEETKND